jgi:hypothetical protein
MHYRKKNNMTRLFLSLIFIGVVSLRSAACDCGAFPPLTKEIFKTNNPKQVVFKGKVLSIAPCNELGECVFMVEALFSGTATRHLSAVYDCSSSCQMTFSPGEEWIIYGEYLQLEKIKIEFCSRSRKMNQLANTEADKIAYGLTSTEEFEWLKQNIGTKPLKESAVNHELAHKNEKPSPTTKIILLIVSMGFMAFFILFSRRFLK